MATAPVVAAAPTVAGLPITIPVSDSTGTVIGTVTGFTTEAGQLLAVTSITGGTGALAGITPQTIELPVTDLAAAGSCSILDLTLGPLDLDLLGLRVQLDQVHLQITAQQGPGNLLGNLLCAVAGLFDGGLLDQVSTLLNRLLGQLTV